MDNPSPAGGLQKIADLAGVSRMTVSRALRNQPNVKPAVREKILRIAAEIGYRPDPLISTLMARLKQQRPGHVSEVIAFLSADSEGPEQWSRSTTARRFFEGASARARQLGYRLEHFWAGERGLTPQRLSRMLWARSISGLLLAPSYAAHQHNYAGFDWRNFAPACLGYTMTHPELHRACNNQYLTMRTALNRLREMGYRRPGLAISRSDDNRVLNHWQAAYLASQAIHAGPDQQLPIFLSDTRMESPANRRPFQRWVLAHRPDVVVSVCHYFLMDWIREAGLRIPDDMGYADLDLTLHMMGKVSGMDQNSERVGAAAVDLIAGQHHRNERGIPDVPTVISVTGEWREGRTVRDSSARD